MAQPFDVVGIGNAIVDVLARTDDAFLERYGLVKGAMTLIDAERAEFLYGQMGAAIVISGGSAGNTTAGIAQLGGRAAFIGKVSNDQLGDVFAHDIRAVGVNFTTQPILSGDPPTARSFILVTPDAQRTMNTYLGAAVELSPEDIDPRLIAAARITYMEGYLWDRPAAKAAFLKAAALAHEAGRQVSLTLSDTFCVERHRDSFRDLVAGHVDVLFGNEHEVMALYQVPTLAEAIAAVRADCAIATITRSEKGAIVLSRTETHDVPAEPIGAVVDTTGAGDLYASGFLYGLTHGQPLADCGRLGNIAAGEVIAAVGARITTDLKQVAAARMGWPPHGPIGSAHQASSTVP